MEKKEKEHFISICSGCKRAKEKAEKYVFTFTGEETRKETGRWFFISGIDFERERDLVSISHSICPECAEEMMLKLKELKRKK